jgi:hypothetical protein
MFKEYNQLCEFWGSHGGEDDDVVLGVDAAWARTWRQSSEEQRRQDNPLTFPYWFFLLIHSVNALPKQRISIAEKLYSWL